MTGPTKGPDWVGIVIIIVILYVIVTAGVGCYEQITEGVPACQQQPECEAYDDPYAGW